MDNNPDFSEDYKSFLNTPMGKNLIKELNARKTQLQDEASKETSQETSYGLSQRANGVMLAIEHIMFLAVTSSNQGNKDTN
jgi:hypothetical protein